MKFLKKHYSNILFILVVLYFAYQQIPVYLHNSDVENQSLEVKYYQTIEGESLEYPKEYNTMMLFWATWCAPCKVEMFRLQKAVEEGELDGKKIFAINPFESALTVKKFLQEKKFSFIFLDRAEYLIKTLDVKATPTIVHCKGHQVDWVTTGISPTGIYRAISFLEKK